MTRRDKAELPEYLVRIAGRKHESRESLQIRVRHHRLKQAPSQSEAAMRCHDEHVGQIAEGRRVGHHARKTELAIGLVQTEAE